MTQYNKSLVVKAKAGTFEVGEHPLDKMTDAKKKEATQLVARGKARWKLDPIKPAVAAPTATSGTADK